MFVAPRRVDVIVRQAKEGGGVVGPAYLTSPLV